ncbi:glycoside hydrolase family 15 protein [Rhizoctonia solani]|uniref:Glycoside hydrolase family 15 protein n=1 Tax=Rhizoctonia solani TaxID=456999 RepID=A0A8H8NNM4_9AGAM|nr:glycoside hydrolase family 15 protein [Rhizoctonia solani]QRW17029.1 glycoside hydrolase family 15 protein [Rhizoctonia solani]
MISTGKYDQEERGYVDIQDHALIGNMRTAALISIDGSVESYCVPNFDSPSVFARILDKDKGGHFSIKPKIKHSSKQAYLPAPTFLADEGVAQVTDFLPRQTGTGIAANKPLLFWLIRRVEVIRGRVPIRMECCPAFNYARDAHETQFVNDDSHEGATSQEKVIFRSRDLTLDLRYVVDTIPDIDVAKPQVTIRPLDLRSKGHQGVGASVDLDMEEGQVITFILRTPPENKGSSTKPTKEQAEALGVPIEVLIQGATKLRAKDDPLLTPNWISKSTYRGSWREAVHRSALALKLLIFEPTGAIVASPTFSLPEHIGGTRNWDYRFSWIRDSSFTLYALIRLGFTEEANAYMDFIFKRLQQRNPDGSLNIMQVSPSGFWFLPARYSIHGTTDLEEIELDHLDGHKGSKPVRIGNGASTHLQLDIYGELLDCIYLGQKFGKPLSWEVWKSVRELVDYAVANCDRKDLNSTPPRTHGTLKDCRLDYVMGSDGSWITTGRQVQRNIDFNYHIHMFSAILDKRSYHAPIDRSGWRRVIGCGSYEEIMERAWNPELEFFAQSYEDLDVLDSAVLVMPLVFFINASDDRFVNTLKQILKSPERGGLVTNNLVFRYDTVKSDDGVGGEEGAFSLCTLWAVEALTRVGAYDKKMLQRAVSMFEDFLGYGNHCGLWSEEISAAGEGWVMRYKHVTLISAAYNLSRTLGQLH